DDPGRSGDVRRVDILEHGQVAVKHVSRLRRSRIVSHVYPPRCRGLPSGRASGARIHPSYLGIPGFWVKVLLASAFAATANMNTVRPILDTSGSVSSEMTHFRNTETTWPTWHGLKDTV